MVELKEQHAVPVAVLVLVVYGFGVGVFQAPNNTPVMSAAPVTARGRVSGLLALSRSLGQIAGVALASTVWDWRQTVYAETATPRVLVMRDAFLVLGGMALVAVMLSLLRGTPERHVDMKSVTH